MTVAEYSLTSCVWAHFWIGFHTCLDGGIVRPLWICWVKSVCMFRCNLPSALLAEWLGSFMCHCSNTGLERTPNKSQYTKLTQNKKIIPCSCQDLNLQPFDHESGILSPELSWLWHIHILNDILIYLIYTYQCPVFFCWIFYQGSAYQSLCILLLIFLSGKHISISVHSLADFWIRKAHASHLIPCSLQCPANLSLSPYFTQFLFTPQLCQPSLHF